MGEGRHEKWLKTVWSPSEVSDMINIQHYVNPNRTGKAGLRIAKISLGSGGLLNKVTLSSSHAPGFSQSDETKNIVVIGAGANGTNLYTTIATFISSTAVKLASPASSEMTKVTIAWWDSSQDDTEGFRAAQDACSPRDGILYCPGDVYIITSPLVASRNLQSLVGDGSGETFFVCTPLLEGSFLSVPGVPSWFSLGGTPTQGFTILGPGFQTPATITAWNITANVVTFIGNNAFKAGQQILLQGFLGADNNIVNNQILTVRASGLSSSQFTAIPTQTQPDKSSVDTGVATLNWNGIAFTSSGADWIGMGNIEIQAFPGDAVQIYDTLVSDFRKLIMSGCGQGFNDLPSSKEGGGTSLTFDTCYANNNYKAGYYVRSLAYSSFNNCAADHNGIAYYFDGAESVSVNGSGSEVQLYRNAAYPGYSYYFHGATNCALNCPYATSGPPIDGQRSGTYLVFDNSSRSIFVNCFKENAQAGAHLPPNAFVIDSTCSGITIWEPHLESRPAKAWTDDGKNDTIYIAGQFQTLIKGGAGADISGNVSSGSSVKLPTPKYVNSSPVSLSDFNLSPGWGDAASFNFVTGSFAAGSFQIKANGAGLAANPTVTFTFPKEEIGSHNPNIVWCRFDGSIAQAGLWLVSGISHTQITWVFVGIPEAGQNVGMQWIASS
jgi:hypothetical protein